MGIDDFAFRKGHDYGTLLCDVTTHEPIDLLENREEETVRQWFQDRPVIQLVTRDRSRAFRQAIHRANPAIIQISDRFHLLHNLGSLLERILKKELPAKIKKASEEKSPEEQENPPDSPLMSYAEKARQESARKKWELALKIKKMRQEGIPYQRIARQVHLHRVTVKTYEEMKGPPDTRKRSRSPIIKPFLSVLEEHVKEGYKTKDIDSVLRDRGYNGSYATVRRYVEELRRKAKKKGRKEAYISRKQAWALFWRPLETLSEKEREILNQVLALYPKTKGIYGFVQLFRQMIQTKDKHIFHYLLRYNQAFHYPAIVSFIHKLKEEKLSIEAALTYSYSNGFMEGNITRLKMIKRQLYGRASVELLKKRIVYRL